MNVSRRGNGEKSKGVGAVSWIVRYDESPIEGIKLPIESSAYSKGERQRLEQQISNSPIAFTVKDIDENVIVSGFYAGEPRDMDWPLETVRRFAEGKINAVRIEYQDGTAYVYNPNYNAVVSDKDE